MEIVQERPTPIAFVKVCSGENVGQINGNIEAAMQDAISNDYFLVRAKTELVFSPSGVASWVTQLEFADRRETQSA